MSRPDSLWYSRLDGQQEVTVSVEPLTWEVLNFWRASGLEFGPTVRGTTVVSRDANDRINGFAAIGDHPDAALKLLIEPLVAKSGSVAIAVVDYLESLLIQKGMPGYSFYVAPGTRWFKQVERLEKLGVFHRLGADERYVWFARKF